MYQLQARCNGPDFVTLGEFATRQEMAAWVLNDATQPHGMYWRDDQTGRLALAAAILSDDRGICDRGIFTWCPSFPGSTALRPWTRMVAPSED